MNVSREGGGNKRARKRVERGVPLMMSKRTARAAMTSIALTLSGTTFALAPPSQRHI
jgi:hypothetical protein